MFLVCPGTGFSVPPCLGEGFPDLFRPSSSRRTSFVGGVVVPTPVGLSIRSYKDLVLEMVYY